MLSSRCNCYAQCDLHPGKQICPPTCTCTFPSSCINDNNLRRSRQWEVQSTHVYWQQPPPPGPALKGNTLPLGILHLPPLPLCTKWQSIPFVGRPRRGRGGGEEGAVSVDVLDWRQMQGTTSSIQCLCSCAAYVFSLFARCTR